MNCSAGVCIVGSCTVSLILEVACGEVEASVLGVESVLFIDVVAVAGLASALESINSTASTGENSIRQRGIDLAEVRAALFTRSLLQKDGCCPDRHNKRV